MTIFSKSTKIQHVLFDVNRCEIKIRAPVFRTIITILGVLVSLIIVIPTVFLLVWAFFGSENVGVLSSKISFKFFFQVLRSHEWQESMVYSTLVAIIVSAIGCIVLTIHFFYLRYVPYWVEKASYLLTISSAIFPAVIYALALKLFGTSIKASEQVLLGVGHLVFVLPIQYFVFESSQESVPDDALFAASTLGASRFRNLFFIYLPLISSAIRSSLLVGFFFSFDEIIIASFVIDSSLITVPKRLWININRTMDPSPAIISSILLFLFISISLLGIAVSIFKARKKPTPSREL